MEIYTNPSSKCLKCDGEIDCFVDNCPDKRPPSKDHYVLCMYCDAVYQLDDSLKLILIDRLKLSAEINASLDKRCYLE
jgi:hypothetical protein